MCNMFFESLDPIEDAYFGKKISISKEGSILSMGSRLSKNILQIGLIESGSLAKFWSDWRSVTKVVIANFLKPF